MIEAGKRRVVFGLLAASLLGATSVMAAQDGYPAPIQVATPQGVEGGYAPGDVVTEEPLIPNAPLLSPTKVIEISAVGMGVAPESTISPAQALALAKRAAIIDAYRQLGEKMYGIRVNGKETVKDMVMQNSIVRTQIMAVIRNAEVTETTFENGLCQVQMELKLDGRRWYGLLTGRRF